jgi:hypothetical protein
MAAILFVVLDSAVPGSRDIAARTIMLAAGHAVTYRSGSAAAPALDAYDLIVISPDCNNTTLGTKYRDAALPLLAFSGQDDGTFFNDMWGPDTHSLIAGATSLYAGTTAFVADAAHDIAAGLSGTVTVYASSTNSTRATAPGTAQVVLRQTDGGQAVTFAYEKGVFMAGGVKAAARRVALGVRSTTQYTPEAAAHFTAGMTWALALPLWETGEFVVHLDVLIERIEGAGTVMQSYRDFFGIYWILSASVQMAGVDRPIGGGTVTLHRQVGGVSLSPLVEASAANLDGATYAPALDFVREIEFRVMLTRPNQDPPEPSTTWPILFQGITDDPDWSRKTGPVTVPFRDRSGPLADTVVRKGITYGDPDTPVDAFVVMQDIVDTEMGAGQYTLVDETVGDRFMVRGYKPEGIFVFQALEALADQWGAKRVHQRQDEETGEAYLAVIEPDRSKTEVDYTIPATVYIEAQNITTGGKNVRTIVVGHAVDKDTGEKITYQLPAEVDVATDPAVLAYGPRVLEFTEDQNSLIDTEAELVAMVTAIYADVAPGVIPLQMETKLAPFARPDLLVRWGANTLLFDNPLTAAVLTVDHNFPGPGIGRTLWANAGSPRASVLGHIRRSQTKVAGIGAQTIAPNRPYFESVTLVESSVGVLTCTVLPGGTMVRYRVYARTGSPPVDVDGEPLPLYLKGPPTEGAEVTEVSWAAQDATHHVAVFGYAKDGARVFTTRSIVVSDTGSGPGTGGGDTGVPDVAPSVPTLSLTNDFVGDTRLVRADWWNTGTSSSWHTQIEWFADGVSTGAPTDIAPTADVSGTATRYFTLFERASARVRYVNQAETPDAEGPWAEMDSSLFVNSFPVPD